MKFYLADDIEVTQIDIKIISSRAKWFLSSCLFWVGDFKNGYELDDMSSASFGSKSWLWEKVDNLFFAKGNLELVGISLHISENVEAVTIDTFKEDLKTFRGNIKLSHPTNFKLNPCRYTKFAYEEDVLILIADEPFLKYNYALEISKNIFLLFRNQKFYGWKVNEATKYLFDENFKEMPLIQRRELIYYLVQYFNLFKPEDKKKMEENDPDIYRKITELKITLKRNQNEIFTPIITAIDDLIDSYF